MLRKWTPLLRAARKYYTVKNEAAAVKDPNTLARQIHAKIKATGPMTVADYMQEVLVSPTSGYYMHRDVFGAGGDFITSPEINQMFGEMVAVWFLNEWSKAGSPKPLQIVELGPGRGTLSQDLLRVFDHFDSLQSASLHLVEVSPLLSELQARRLCLQADNIQDKEAVVFKQGLAHQGVPVKWYRHLDDVPAGFSLVVAHEFFDALPVHKFQHTEHGYREVLVDIDEDKEFSFRYVISREATPACKIFVSPKESRSHFEVSPASLVLCKNLAKRIDTDGGMALIADYGHDGSGTDTFRAFKKHQLHEPLVEPGTADLTADVDFSMLKKVATESSDVLTFGPVTQRSFLLKLGIEHRYKTLEANANEEQLKALKFGYHMITDEDQMGNRFKFLSILPATMKPILDRYPPVGFH